MELTIEHLMPYAAYDLPLMDLETENTDHPVVIILEGFDLSNKEKPIIAERVHWKLSEVKPFLRPLDKISMEKKKELAQYLLRERYQWFSSKEDALTWIETALMSPFNDLPYIVVKKLFKWCYAVDIPEEVYVKNLNK